MGIRLILTSLICCLIVVISVAQTTDDVMEEMMSSNPESDDIQLITLTNLDGTRKYNLNTITSEIFQLITFLSEHEINSILQHRTQFNGFLDVLELQQCELSEDKIMMLLEFVEIPFNHRSSKIQKYKHQTSLTYLNQTSAQNKTQFDGDGSKFVYRYRFEDGARQQLGFTSEKDAGEKYFNTKFLQILDHNSGYWAFKTKKELSVILGDYTANFGQGLVVGQGFSTSKSALVMNIANLAKGITPYRSLDENRYFRGFSMSKNFKYIDYSIFVSRLRRDANLDDNTIVSINYSRLHRNQLEYPLKNAFLATEFGTDLKYSVKNHVIGLSLIRGYFDKEVAESERLDKRFDFYGSHYFKGGIHHSSQYNSVRFFGEIALDHQLYHAFLEGMQWSLGRYLDASILYRYFHAGFNSIHAQSFGEVNEVSNEQGLYFALRLNKNRWNFSTYTDFFKKLWPSYGNLSPTDGHEQMLEAQYRHSRKTNLYFRYRIKNKSDYKRISNDLVLTGASTERYRLHVETTLDNQIRLRGRVEFAKYTAHNQPVTTGSMMYYDIQKKSILKNLDVTLRIMTSNVEDFNSRIYVFENDLPLTYSMTFFDGAVFRLYGLFHFRLSENLDFWVKFAHQFQQGNVAFNEGHWNTSNDKLNQYKFQLRYRI